MRPNTTILKLLILLSHCFSASKHATPTWWIRLYVRLVCMIHKSCVRKCQQHFYKSNKNQMKWKTTNGNEYEKINEMKWFGLLPKDWLPFSQSHWVWLYFLFCFLVNTIDFEKKKKNGRLTIVTWWMFSVDRLPVTNAHLIKGHP